MTSSPISRPIIRLDWPFNADPPELHCPRTGELVVSNGEDEVEQPASPHVTFVYPEVVGEFVYLRDDLRARLGGHPRPAGRRRRRPGRPGGYRSAARTHPAR